ncbi:hypothetical protein RhiirA1_453576 [Rhizophagus irregularis]|uniref:Uncharacterized protein n=1 Tax=Rhizophagus irregularis TaxID=588596 RepID=A0A2N0S772_9GLOM|nr:hypothetical protein RhiirA1_453576 [Rhizophagus irregularis]CAB5193225.1 unnamed protein product [Rhizophagus irregularis]CAB5369392.1 unnamed protein product [Rhizophagus irregularis]
MSIKDIEYALMLLTTQDLNDSFDSFNDDELDNNNKKKYFLLILFTLSCSHETMFLSLNIGTVILKKLEFVQWPKNNNRAIIHAGFQAIGVSECYWSNRWDNGTHFILNEAPAQDQTAFFTRIKKICNSLSRNR